MTIKLSEFQTSDVQPFSPQPKKNRRRLSVIPRRASEAVRMTDSILENKQDLQTSCNRLSHTMRMADLELRRILDLETPDRLVIRSSGFSQSQLALIIHCESASCRISVPKSGVVSFDYANPDRASIECSGLELLAPGYFIARRCALV